MNTLTATLRDIAASIARAMNRAADSVSASRARRADRHAQAICPADSWAFTPLYTSGHCPLCGWRPDGYDYAPPPFTPYERYWGAMGGIAAVSLAMCVAVVVAVTRGW